MKPAAFLRIERDAMSARRRGIRNAVQHGIRDRDINALVVRRRTPLAAAQQAACPGASLPQNFALRVRIDRMHHAGFLRDDQRALAAAQLHQNGRLSEIEVGTVLVGTICARPAGAAHCYKRHPA